MSAVSPVQSSVRILPVSVKKSPKNLSSLEAVLPPKVPKARGSKSDVKPLKPGKAKRTLAHESKAYLAQQWVHIHDPAENLKLDKLTPKGRYAYAASRKLKECAFKITDDEQLTAAIKKYSKASFVFLDMKIKKEVIETLCAYATNETAKDALRRFHLERFCPHDNKTPICYSFEAEHTNKNIYRWYGPENDVLELKDAKVNLKDFHTYLTKDAKKKWPTDEIEITKKLIEKTFKWTDLTLSGRKAYVLSIPKEKRQLFRRAGAPSHLVKVLDWASDNVWEVKTATFYPSLDALYFSLDEFKYFMKPRKFHVHVTFEPTVRDKESVDSILHAMNVFNQLIFLENSSADNFKNYFWDVYSASALEALQRDLCAERTSEGYLYDDVQFNRFKLFYLGFRGTYPSPTLRGFEIRGGTHSTSSNRIAVNYWGQMAGMLSDILTTDGFNLLKSPKPQFFEEEIIRGEPYALSEKCADEDLTKEDVKAFFGYAKFVLKDNSKFWHKRALTPFMNWEEMPYFPKNKKALQKLTEIRQTAIDSVVLLVKDHWEKNAKEELVDADAFIYGEGINKILLQFQKDLLELTKISRQEFRAKLQLAAWAKEKSLKAIL